MSEPPLGTGEPPRSWDGTGAAMENAAHAARALGSVQDVLRTAFPQEWVSVAADGYSGRLIDLLGRSQRLGDVIDDARAATGALARELAADGGGPP